jgi:hypothetical protein
VRYIGADSETERFSPGDMAPALVCVQWQELGSTERHIQTVRAGAVATIRAWLLDPDVTLVLHNAAYDAAVWCREGLTAEVFAAYEAGRMLDTHAYERLGEIAGFSTRKKLDLATCLKAHGLPAPPLKDEGLATEFGQFLDCLDIPEPHRSYALDDCAVIQLFARQRKRFERDVPMQALQTFSRTAFWLHLMSVWGLLTSPDAVESLRSHAEEQLAFLRPAAVEAGFLRANGTRNMAAIRGAVEEAYGPAACPRTPTGRAQTSALVLSESHDPALEAFAHYGELLKTVSADVPMLLSGILHPRYGIADTGRTTCSRPNVQNLPKKGGVRGCIVPAPGHLFLERDYSGIELCTFAQTCVWELGRHHMADAINSSGDPGYLHALLGGHLLKCSPEELLKRRKSADPAVKDLAENARTRAKNANFGFIGGLGYTKYVDYVRMLSKGKIILTLEESKALKRAWGEANPDGPAYLEWVGSTELPDGTYEAVIPGSGILRRGMWYCAAANCRFQGLAAAIMAEAGWALVQACLLGELARFGVRVVAFIHDAFILEVPAGCEAEVDVIFERILREAAARVMPDVLTKSEAKLLGVSMKG